ncbi:MAG: hypothetical protein IPG25_02800 [Proteobacteria bacterium]|nr:hypothetical protein [Pseudomonadota bacterium]
MNTSVAISRRSYVNPRCLVAAERRSRVGPPRRVPASNAAPPQGSRSPAAGIFRAADRKLATPG